MVPSEWAYASCNDPFAAFGTETDSPRIVGDVTQLNISLTKCVWEESMVWKGFIEHFGLIHREGSAEPIAGGSR